MTQPLDYDRFSQLLEGEEVEPASLTQLSSEQAVRVLSKLDTIVGDVWDLLPTVSSIEWPGGPVPPAGYYPFDRSNYRVAVASDDGRQWLCRAWYHGPIGWGVDLSRAFEQFPVGFTVPGWPFFRKYFESNPHQAYQLLEQSVRTMHAVLRQLMGSLGGMSGLVRSPLDDVARLAKNFSIELAN